MPYEDYSKWTIPDREWEDHWEFRRFKEYPAPDEEEKFIKMFIADAKMAEEDIEEKLEESGVSKEEAHRISCQWPLKDDAPMEAVREFIKYMYSVQQAEKNGIYL